MSSNVDYNKLIKQAVNVVLKPHGLFQKGTARVWIDDNGWYLTVVEFQPSAWDKGTYLNVSVHFLWDEKDYLSYDYYTGKTPRINRFISFDGDEAWFVSEIQRLAEAALNEVMLYRKLRDLRFAEDAILRFEAHHIVNTLYLKMMICGLNHDPRAQRYFEELLEELCRFVDVEWTRPIYMELTDKVAPILSDSEQFYLYICKKIDNRRTFWREKSSMKKMSKVFSVP